jgi:hypothetical protein
MNIVILLISFILFMSNNIVFINCNYCTIRLRNTAFRMVIFKEKKIPNLIKKFSNFYKICYEKSIASLGAGMCDYTSLSEDEKTLIETVISLCY